MEELDDKLVEGVLNEELYMFSSFYPAPIDSILREALTEKNIELTEENVRKIKRKENEFVLGDEVLLRVVIEPIEGVEGWVGSRFVTGDELNDK